MQAVELSVMFPWWPGVLQPGASPNAAPWALLPPRPWMWERDWQSTSSPELACFLHVCHCSGWREKEEKTCGLTENDMEKTTKLTEKQTKKNQRAGGERDKATGTTCEQGGQESLSVLWTD